MSILMGLGPFRFEAGRHAYEELERTVGGRWPAQERIGRRPALQFLGPAESEIEISATIFPHFSGGLEQVDAMGAAAEAGATLMLVSGAGRVFGRWVIKQLKDKQSYIDRDGTPRKVEVEITLARYGEDGASFGGLFS
jgi:uncharacterized protein